MRVSNRYRAAAALVLAIMVPDVVRSATPLTALVIAKNVDDIISLDPGEAYEASGGEVINNVYDRLIRYEAADVTTLVGGVAETWTVSLDGRTFQSGDPVTAADAAFSLQRVVKALDPSTLVLRLEAYLAPSLVLNVISSTIGSVVDEKVAIEHAKGNDLGNGWLKNHSAGSGAFDLRSWSPDENVVLEANPRYHLGAPKMARVILRHVPEPASQRLLLDKGDIDVARNLTPDQIEGLNGAESSVLTQGSADSFYLAPNQTEPHLANPKAREALRLAIDYDGMVGAILKGQAAVHQSFLSSGFWSSIPDRPYRLDIAKAKALLAEADYPNGFSIEMDA